MSLNECQIDFEYLSKYPISLSTVKFTAQASQPNNFAAFIYLL